MKVGVNELHGQWLRQWLFAVCANYYLNQCWLPVNWSWGTISMKFRHVVLIIFRVLQKFSDAHPIYDMKKPCTGDVYTSGKNKHLPSPKNYLPTVPSWAHNHRSLHALGQNPGIRACLNIEPRGMHFKMLSAKWQPFCQASCVNPSQTETLQYSALTRSIQWLLVYWLLASPGHQPWYRLCRIKGLSPMRKNFK